MSRVANYLICLVFVIFPGTVGAEGLLDGPESVVYDSVQNRYLVSNWIDGSVVEIDSNGVQSYFITGRPNCGGSHIHGNILYSGSGNDIVWINLSTASITRYLSIPEATLLNAITSDNLGNLYVTDALPGIVYKIEGDEGPMYSEFVNSGLDVPVGITYDEDDDRLLVTGNSRIYEVTLPDGIVSVVANTGLGYMDAIIQDPDGNFYVSCSYANTVYKFDPTFSDPPELFSSGHHWPSQLCYNPEGFVLAVPNFNSSSIDFIEDPYKHDDDDDGHFNALDNCPVQFNPGQEDIDVDGVGDICDNCPEAYNPGQSDVDGDGIGDSCEVIRTWYVEPEGTGDAPTIQAAIDSCTHWDTVIVADGIYTDEGAWNVNLERKQIIFKSENGPATTIIDCQGSPVNPRRGVTVCNVPEGFCIIEGFTIRNGYGPNFNGGSSGGAILCDNSSPVIRNCILINNSAFIGGALTSDHSAPQLVNCTLFGNAADYGAAIAAYDYSEVIMENCIMAFHGLSDLVSCFGSSTVSLSCSDVFGNAGGDWAGCITGQDQINGNFSADPEFCHVIAEDFGLLETSPCAPANNDCSALVGALGVGCSCDCGVWGDVNQDGNVNPLDGVYMVQYVYLSHDLRVHPPNCPYGTGDVNCDGNVNPVDMVHFVNYVYLSITPFPCPDPCAF